MGEVYRARDTKLHRDVAVKVLPERFALDPDRLARFRREAQLLAALNHPNIAAIYGLEESTGTRGRDAVNGPTGYHGRSDPQESTTSRCASRACWSCWLSGRSWPVC